MSDLIFVTVVPAWDMAVLNAACNALRLDETAGDAMLLRCEGERRQWCVESRYGRLDLDVEDEATQLVPPRWLAISERVRRFARIVDAEELTLHLVDDESIVASHGELSAAIDLVPRRQHTPDEYQVRPVATCAVDLAPFLGALTAARAMPAGIGDTSHPMPPMWLHLGDGSLSLHVDWRDFIDGRSTYRIGSVQHDGELTVSIPHPIIEMFLNGLPAEEDSVVITIGRARGRDGERDAIVIQSVVWRLLLWLEDPLEERWGERVDAALAAEDSLRVIDRSPAEWLVSADGHDVRVKLHAAQPDVARVSAPLVIGAQESLDLLRELIHLNESSNGVRYWLADEVVWAAVDVPCMQVTSLLLAIGQVLDARATYAAMIMPLAQCA